MTMGMEFESVLGDRLGGAGVACSAVALAAGTLYSMVVTVAKRKTQAASGSKVALTVKPAVVKPKAEPEVKAGPSQRSQRSLRMHDLV